MIGSYGEATDSAPVARMHVGEGTSTQVQGFGAQSFLCHYLRGIHRCELGFAWAVVCLGALGFKSKVARGLILASLEKHNSNGHILTRLDVVLRRLCMFKRVSEYGVLLVVLVALLRDRRSTEELGSSLGEVVSRWWL